MLVKQWLIEEATRCAVAAFRWVVWGARQGAPSRHRERMRCTKHFGIVCARPARDATEGTPGLSRAERHLSYKQIRFWPGFAAMRRRRAVDRSRIGEIQCVNARNHFRGRAKEIIEGPVVSEVDVATPFGLVNSVITTRSVKELQLAVGTEVIALVKATEVAIAKV
jgi:molybdopterin-binding protein